MTDEFEPPENYKAEEHHVSVVYFNMDDGLHLKCSCKWEESVGFWPTPEHLVLRASAHKRTTGRQ
jgi:hypothetical protein